MLARRVTCIQKNPAVEMTMLYESDNLSLDNSRSNQHVSELLSQRDAAALEKLIEWYRPAP